MTTNIPSHHHTASAIAKDVGLSKRAVLLALRDVPPSTVEIVNGQETRVWERSVLPKRFQLALVALDGRETPGTDGASSVVALSECHPDETKRAVKLRSALSPLLERGDAPCLSRDDMARLGVEKYREQFGHEISLRHWWRLYDLALARDNGAQQWANLRLYMSASPRRRTALAVFSSAAEEDFRPLHDHLAGLSSATEPTPSEKEAVWLRALEVFAALADDGRPEKKLRRRLVKFLWAHAPFLSRSSESLRVNFQRKFEAWKVRGDSSVIDGRIAKQGEQRAEPLNAEDVETVRALSVNKYRGRHAPAVRQAVDEGLVTDPRIVASRQRTTEKSYVLPALRAKLGNTDALWKMGQGKRAIDNLTPSMDLDYAGIYSMDAVTADDFTFCVYFWIPDGQGWYTLTRGQAILVVDFRTLRVLSYALRPAKQYDALTVRTCFTTAFDAWGLPKFIYREGGLWRRAKLVNSLAGVPGTVKVKAPAVSNVDLEYGLRRAGTRVLRSHDELLGNLAEMRIEFIEAYKARSKPIERVGGLLQDMMGGEPMYSGRDERRDCPEVTKRMKLLVESRKESPVDLGIYSFAQWDRRLGEIIEKWNAEPHGKRAKRIGGLSPDDAFERVFWPVDDPPTRLDASTRFLLAADRLDDLLVKAQGIEINGKTYAGKEVMANVGRKVTAWWNPELPELVTFTDANKRNGFMGELIRSKALHPDAQSKESFRVVGEHMGVLRTAYHALKAKHAPNFRRNIVDPRTRELGEQIETQRVAVETERKETSRRTTRVRTGARAAGVPDALIGEATPEALEAMQMLRDAQASEKGETK